MLDIVEKIAFYSASRRKVLTIVFVVSLGCGWIVPGALLSICMPLGEGTVTTIFAFVLGVLLWFIGPSWSSALLIISFLYDPEKGLLSSSRIEEMQPGLKELLTVVRYLQLLPLLTFFLFPFIVPLVFAPFILSAWRQL